MALSLITVKYHVPTFPAALLSDEADWAAIATWAGGELTEAHTVGQADGVVTITTTDGPKPCVLGDYIISNGWGGFYKVASTDFTSEYDTI